MNAMERIKEIEKKEPRLVGLDEDHQGIIMLAPKDFQFLLRALKVMRRMAIYLRHDDGQFGWGLGEKDYENIIDKEFNKRMGKVE